MTIQEAINQLEFDRAMIFFDPDTGRDLEITDEIAIEALIEVAQYRKIGTVEECKEAVDKDRAKNL